MIEGVELFIVWEEWGVGGLSGTVPSACVLCLFGCGSGCVFVLMRVLESIRSIFIEKYLS